MITKKEKRITTEKIKLPSILVIDDIDKNVAEIKALLSDYPYKIQYASDGYAAFDIVKVISPILIIMSVDIPQGFYHCGKFKKNKFFRQIPLILTSSKVSPKTFQEHRRLHSRADGYLLRPFLKEQFLNIISEVLPEGFLEASKKEAANLTAESQTSEDTPPEIRMDFLTAYQQDEVATLKATITRLVYEREQLASRVRELGGTSSVIELPSVQPDELMEVSEDGETTPVCGAVLNESASVENLAAQANLVVLEESVKTLEQEIEKLKEENRTLSEEKESQIEFFSQLESSYKEQIENIQKEKIELEKGLKNSEAKCEELQDKIKQLKKTIQT